ncbi:alpha/beta fold hydrolase [Chenggangzhangella methanolivorans]|uniref:alpha/beta fold hydrolase n=1 Tax=Chenggangzhangella methanolivorans TaxID=1437009 RepID=UPI0021BD0766|nr:alpha/beta hydrolase [Chenggangzhangella methanolivorans]
MELSIGRRLARRHRVILVDRPGHGGSDRLGGRAMASPALQADAIVEALDRLGVARVVAVGHSWSGALATNLALDHPTRVAGLVTLSGATHPLSGRRRLVQRDRGDAADRRPVQRDARRAGRPRQVRRGRRLDVPPQDPAAPLHRADRRDAPAAPGRVQGERRGSRRPEGVLEAPGPALRRDPVPTTIVTADKDDIVSPELHSRALHHQVRGSRLVVLKDAGHMPHWTATARVVVEIEAVARKAR